jgi:hypothetical protein
VLQVIGSVFFLAGASFGIAMWFTDRRLQQYRAPSAPHVASVFVPLRWRRAFYTREGQPLVTLAWQQLCVMYALAIVGLVFIALGAG